jgi:hypothetical protein
MRRFPILIRLLIGCASLAWVQGHAQERLKISYSSVDAPNFLVEGDQQRYVAGDNLGQNPLGGADLLFSTLSAIKPAKMSCRIVCSSGVNAPLARLADAGHA